MTSSPSPEVVGQLVSLRRYPVKSMGDEVLDAAEVGWHGVDGDRRWAFVRPDSAALGFPWLTIRQLPQMGHYRPVPGDPDRVVTPSGVERAVSDPALAAELGEGVRVMKQNRGIFDVTPLSLMSTQTVASLDALVDVEVDALRFRPNLVVEASGSDPFPEDAWVGRTLRIGTLRMRVDLRDKRCVMVNTDPVSLRRDPEVLRAIAQERQACLGVYGSVVAPGRLAVGDAVLLEPG